VVLGGTAAGTGAVQGAPAGAEKLTAADRSLYYFTVDGALWRTSG